MHNSTREHFFRSLMSVTTGILVLSAGIFSTVFAKEVSIANATRDHAIQLLENRQVKQNNAVLNEDGAVVGVLWQKSGHENDGYVSSTQMEIAAISSDRVVLDAKIQTDKQKSDETHALASLKKTVKNQGKDVSNTKKIFDANAKKGIGVTSECSDTLDIAQQIVSKSTTASSTGEIDNTSLNNSLITLKTCRDEANLLSSFSERLKKTDQQVATLSKQWLNSKKNAPRDATDAIADGDAALASMKDARATALLAIQNAEISKAKLIIEDQILGKFDDVRVIMHRIDAMRNSKTYVKTIVSRLKEDNQTIIRLQSLGKDTSQAQGIVTTLQDKQKEIQSLTPGTAAYTNAVNDFANTNQKFAEAIGGTESIGNIVGKGTSS